jgi:hypothetical protein
MHKFHDGSVLKIISSKELITIPVWKGNRIIDLDHVKTIHDAITDIQFLDSGYRIIHIEEENTFGKTSMQSYLIDGQHRAHILREHYKTTLCEPEFDVVVIEKTVTSETEAIEFFNQINNVKPQQWKSEPAILIQPYIKELEKCFNTKIKLIRPGNTCRPYLSIDKVRDILLKYSDNLSQSPSKITEFGKLIISINEKLLQEAPIKILENTKDTKLYEKAMNMKFMLAIEPKLTWLINILTI